MDAGLVQTIVVVDVVNHGPREGGVVIAGGEVTGVVGVTLVGARFEAQAGGFPGQGAWWAQWPIRSAGMD